MMMSLQVQFQSPKVGKGGRALGVHPRNVQAFILTTQNDLDLNFLDLGHCWNDLEWLIQAGKMVMAHIPQLWWGYYCLDLHHYQ